MGALAHSRVRCDFGLAAYRQKMLLCPETNDDLTKNARRSAFVFLYRFDRYTK